jgi:hypothetical protein
MFGALGPLKSLELKARSPVLVSDYNKRWLVPG